MLTILLCILAADFITGLIHWVEDTYGLPSWPILGRLVIEPNIEHHLAPSKMCESPVWLRNYQSVVPALVIGVPVFCVLGKNSGPVLLTLLLASFGNEVHSWAHSKHSNPWWIRFLQDSALILTPEHHAKHHKKPYDRHFCTLTNFTNAVLDLIRFWKVLEVCLSFVGIKPKRLSQERMGV